MQLGSHKNGSSKKIRYLTFLILVLIVAAVVVILLNDKKKPHPVVTGTTSKPTVHKISTNNSSPSGVTDNNGKTTATLPPSSEWVSSSSGEITLQNPVANSVVSSGEAIEGLSKLSSVQFILSDNSVGLIEEGTLNVVDGKFSGTLQFTPHSSTGKLEIYYPNPSNGAEEDIVDVNVTFNNQ